MMNQYLHRALSFTQKSFGAKIVTIVVLVMLTDFLFYGHHVGWTMGAFGFMLVGAYALHNFRYLKTKMGVTLIVLTIGQCLVQIEKVSLLSFILMAIGLISMSILQKSDWHSNALIWMRSSLSVLFRIIRPLNEALRVYKKDRARHSASNPLSRFIRGWFLPLFLSFMFVYLFSMANPIISDWLGDISFSSFWNEISIRRLSFWLVMLCFIFAIIRPKLKSKKEAVTKDKPSKEMGVLEWAFSKESVLRSLVIFNVMFAFQTIMDVNYLWGGGDLPTGVTYASYAHKGAYPLIVTALLAAVFALVAQSKKTELVGSKFTMSLLYIWIAQNVLLVFSSIYRTTLYVEIYALTYMRVAAFIWMGLVACGLLLIIYRGIKQKSNVWLINTNILVLFTVLYAVSFANIGGFIAQYNVSHSKEVSGKGVVLDMGYLRSIGAVSVPAVQDSGITLSARHVSMTMHKLKRDMNDWRRWTFSDYRLLKTYGQDSQKNTRPNE